MMNRTERSSSCAEEPLYIPFSYSSLFGESTAEDDKLPYVIIIAGIEICFFIVA
ncbi:MAG: hypothetical protein K6A70_07965 [Erysipelotrichaceae bacterium]|nr:hypothetical protein [Erysipelotrichaceae bacterium]